LRDSDVMSMAFGLELRVPFLDVPLVETALRVPAGERLAAGKRFLLAAVPEIPEWVAGRPKRGFVFPFQRWLGEEWKQMLGDVSVPRDVLAQSWYQQWSVFVLKHWLARLTA